MPRVLSSGELAEARAIVSAGGLVAAPNTRWYMMCADAENGDACRRIFGAKQRPRDKPLLRLVDGVDELDRLASSVSPLARRLAAEFWPGELALELPARPGVEHGESGQVLVCQPAGLLGELSAGSACAIATAVVSFSLGGPAGPTPPALSVADVLAFDRQAGGVLAAVIDGGVFHEPQHLTIVRVDGDTARLVRAGGLDWATITAVAR